MALFDEVFDVINSGNETEPYGIFRGCKDPLHNSLDRHGFEQIERTERLIEHIKQRLSGGKTSRRKKLRAQFKLQTLEAHLIRLKAGHEEVAKKLIRRARALEILPRELRDAVLEQLYISEKPIQVSWSRVGDSNIFLLPKDEALYLSKLHVGDQIAMEAAEIFYRYNTFEFRSDYVNWTAGKLDEFLDYDYYGSGIIPRDHIRKIRFHLKDALSYELNGTPGWGQDDQYMADHLTFEKSYLKASGDSFDDRKHVQFFSGLQRLQELTIVASAPQGSDRLMRILNPSVRQMRIFGIKVRVELTVTLWPISFRDVTHIFADQISQEDQLSFERIAKRKYIDIDHAVDPLETWWQWSKIPGLSTNKDLWDVDDAGFVRTWLLEHYHFCQWYQKYHEPVAEWAQMETELSLLKAESRILRKKYYTRMVELVSSELEE